MKIFELLTAREKRQALAITALAVIAAFMETIGVASVVPFLTALGDPDLIQSNAYLKRLYDWMGYTSSYSFLVALGVASFCVVMFSTVFRTFATYIMNRFIEMRRHSISERLLEIYLHQPYEFFIQTNSANLSTSILSEVDQIIQNGFRPLIYLIAYVFVLAAMMAFLMIVDVKTALSVAVVIGGSYALIFASVRRILSRIGLARVEANRLRFHAATEAFSAIKDIKLLGNERSYLARFRAPSTRNAQYQALSTTLTQLPKFFIEAIGFGGVVMLALVLLMQSDPAHGNPFGQILPVLGIYALAGMRILPAAQNIYTSVANLRFSIATIEATAKDLRRPVEPRSEAASGGTRLGLKREIRFEELSYTYPNAKSPAIDGIDAVFPVGAKVGLVGSTGCGKTTLVDLLLGLLTPSSGRIVIDGVTLGSSNIRAWQAGIGYVRQDIVLSDCSVASNIALGVEAAAIDMAQVERSARIANIHDVITHQMSKGYDTEVGERGIRLSGGQKQRLGIARAMYRNPQVIILDEATSALDGKTETDVMGSVYRLGGQITVVIIAHRLSTVKECDFIILLEAGKIVAQGTYDGLLETSEKFRQLAAWQRVGGGTVAVDANP